MTWCGTTLTTVAVMRRLERGSATDTDLTGARLGRGRRSTLDCTTRTADESLTWSARANKGAPGGEMCGDSCVSSHPRGACLLQAGAKLRQGRGVIDYSPLDWEAEGRGLPLPAVESESRRVAAARQRLAASVEACGRQRRRTSVASVALVVLIWSSVLIRQYSVCWVVLIWVVGRVG